MSLRSSCRFMCRDKHIFAFYDVLLTHEFELGGFEEIGNDTDRAAAYDEGFGRKVALLGATASGHEILDKVGSELSLFYTSSCTLVTCRLIALSSSRT